MGREAAALRVYHVDSVEPLVLRQAEVLAWATEVVDRAVHELRRSRKLSDLREALGEIHRLESVGDDNHHAALSKISDGTFPPLFVIKRKELHTLVEDAIDTCERVGHVVERIILSNA